MKFTLNNMEIKWLYEVNPDLRYALQYIEKLRKAGLHTLSPIKLNLMKRTIQTHHIVGW
jgi:hypothetical protein